MERPRRLIFRKVSFRFQLSQAILSTALGHQSVGLAV
jgi:hypothetical protein